MLPSTLPISLDDTLPASLDIHYSVSSQDTPQYTSEKLSSTLPSIHFSNQPLAGMMAGTKRDTVRGVWLAVLGRRQVVCARWNVVGRTQCILADIILYINMVVWTLSLAQPPLQDLTMAQPHGVDSRSFRFCRKCRQLNHGESRSLMQFSLWNLQPVSHWFWAYVGAFSEELMVMLVMVMVMVKMMVLVMVTVMVLKAHSYVGWLCQSQH